MYSPIKNPNSQMFQQDQAIIPNFISISTPNSQPPDSNLLAPADLLNGSFSQTIDFTAFQHVGVIKSETSESLLPKPESLLPKPESLLPFHCEACNISCNTNDVLEKHKQGKKHLRSVERVGNLANLSDNAPKTVPPPVASETVIEELENKKLRLLQNGAVVETLLSCDMCQVFCNSREGFQKHLDSKKHAAKASQKAVFDAVAGPSSGSQKKPDPYRCEICKITCTSSEHLQSHIEGKKHRKKLQEMGTVPNLPLTPIASQETPPTNPMVNPVSNEAITINLRERKPVCELCGITCDTNEVFKIHTTGKKHLKKLKNSGSIPNLPLAAIASQDTPPIEPVKQGAIAPQDTPPTEPLKQAAIASKDTPPTEPVENLDPNEGKTVVLQEAKPACELCGISCDTLDVLKTHISGKKHRKNLEKSAAKAIVIGPAQEQDIVVNPDENKRKTRGGVDEAVEAKKQKIVQSGTSSDAVQTCTLCNVVCNSLVVFKSHLLGQKHVVMAAKQAAAQAIATAAAGQAAAVGQNF